MMYLPRSTVLLLLAATAAKTAAFGVTPDVTPGGAPCATARKPTKLHISSWGTSGRPRLEKKDPAHYIQDYLKEPDAVEARANVDGRILVSTHLSAPASDTIDQFLLDLLNHEDSAFEFEKIAVYAANAAATKKALLSRSARYTGLLDKLDVVQAADNEPLPPASVLSETKTWLAVVDNLESCHAVAQILQSAPTVENVALLLQGANEWDEAACQAAWNAIAATGKQYTIVAVGALEDRPEGQAYYHFADFGSQTLPAKAVFSKHEAYRVVTELLQLECGVNQALTFAEIYNVNATEVKLIKGLREAGYARPQEMDHMIRSGPTAYKDAIETFRTENPDAALGYTTNAWWEAAEYQKSRERSDAKLEAEQQAVKDERTLEIEAIAKEWAKREYFRQSMAGELKDDMTEEAYMESVWERAMFEGDLKYRVSRGEVEDEEAELADFQARQARKQETMLKRAKDELAEVLGDAKDKKDE